MTTPELVIKKRYPHWRTNTDYDAWYGSHKVSWPTSGWFLRFRQRRIVEKLVREHHTREAMVDHAARYAEMLTHDGSARDMQKLRKELSKQINEMSSQ